MYAGALNLYISNTGNKEIKTPWNLKLLGSKKNFYKGISDSWNWEPRLTRTGTVFGQATQEWLSLKVGQEGNLGLIVEAEGPNIIPTSIFVNKEQCEVVMGMVTSVGALGAEYISALADSQGFQDAKNKTPLDCVTPLDSIQKLEKASIFMKFIDAMDLEEEFNSKTKIQTIFVPTDDDMMTLMEQHSITEDDLLKDRETLEEFLMGHLFDGIVYAEKVDNINKLLGLPPNVELPLVDTSSSFVSCSTLIHVISGPWSPLGRSFH